MSDYYEAEIEPLFGTEEEYDENPYGEEL